METELHVGRKIDAVLGMRHMTRRELGESVGLRGNTASYLISRKSVDVYTLWKIGRVLKYNFFKDYPVAEDELAAAATPERKLIDELQLKVKGLEKELEDVKVELMKQENYFLKKVNELLDRGRAK